MDACIVIIIHVGAMVFVFGLNCQIQFNRAEMQSNLICPLIL